MNLWNLFESLLRVSLQASVLVVLVLLAQVIFRHQLSARWRYALWGLVLLRLLLPVSVQSPFSLFALGEREALRSWAPMQPAAVSASLMGSTTPVTQDMREGDETSVDAAGIKELSSQSPPHATPTEPRPGPVSFHVNWRRVSPILWLAGVATLALGGGLRNVRFCIRLRSARLIVDPDVLRLWGECAKRMSVTASVRLLETGAVTSPAVYGLFRYSLLVPEGMLGQLNRNELTHVFLHELAHLRRRDLLVHWITGAMRVLHWFNPVVWFAVRRMNGDRELACDELVLRVAGPQCSREYGRTIIKLMEDALGRHAVPSILGISEDQHHLERRMTMIANFNPDRKGTCIALTVLILLAATTLTDGRTVAAESRAVETRDTPDTIPLGSIEAAVTLLTDLGAEIERDDSVPGEPVTQVSVRSFDPSRGQTQTFSFENEHSFRHYRFKVLQVQYDGAEDAQPEYLQARRCMQVREVELLNAQGHDITRPGDPMIASSTNSPAGEDVTNAVDDRNTKYVNLDMVVGLPAGFIVSPSLGTTRVTGLSIVSANDVPSRDPKVVTLEGSNDERLTAYESGTWEMITELEITPWTDLWHESDRRFLAEDYYQAFEALPDLKSLTVPGSLVTDAGMERLSTLPNLETLILYGRTWLTDHGMSHLPAFPKLEHLDLYDTTEVTDRGMQYVAERRNMRRLGIVSSRLSGSSGITDKACSYLKDMSHLDSLLLMGTRVTDKGLEHFENLTNVTFINLGANPLITGEGLKHFSGMKKLHTLWIFNTGLSDVALQHLSHLDSLKLLSLSSTYITDEGLAHLRPLAKLEKLDLGAEMRPTLTLGGTQIGNEGLVHLQHLKSLKTLWLDRTRVTDDGLKLLASMEQLEELSLTHTRVTDAGLVHLKPLTNLATLYLSDTQITDAGLATIAEMPALTGLVLSRTSVSDAGLERLAAMRQLRGLHLQGTGVTQAGIDKLKQELPELYLRL